MRQHSSSSLKSYKLHALQVAVVSHRNMLDGACAPSSREVFAACVSIRGSDMFSESNALVCKTDVPARAAD